VAERLRHLVHLVTRFLTSLVPRRPRPAELACVDAVLTSSELAVWKALSRADRVESLATLRRLPHDVARDGRWAAAALLHDAGKSASGLGTFGRVVATVRGALARGGDVDGRAGVYLRHAEVGADILQEAGARTEVVAWAGSHHDRARWPVETIPASVCAALARADGERA
jgi:putative nucleotidyltransferase with HDIG domain